MAPSPENISNNETPEIESGIRDINSLKNLIDSDKNAKEINQVLDADFLKNLGNLLNIQDAETLKEKIKNLSGFDENGNTALNELYNYVVSMCDGSDADDGNNENNLKPYEITFENLPNLDEDSIQKVFSGLNKQEIVKFFNKQKARTDLTDNQKTWLRLTYIGLTRRFFDKKDNENRGKIYVEVLQSWFKKDVKVDGNFGIETFNALRTAFGEEIQGSDINSSQNSNETNNTTPGEVMFGDDKLPIKEANGRKFVEIDGNKYYEYEKGMNGLGYQNGINSDFGKWTYVGNFENGKKKGIGTKTWADGYKYQGEWKDDKMEGQGIVSYCGNHKGDKYEGKVKNNEREGEGTYTFKNGNVFKGIFKNDGLKSPATFILNSYKYEVIIDNGLWKVTTKGEYEGKYISPDTGEFVDKDPSNIQVNSHEELIQKLKDIKDNTIEYQFDDKTTFTFTKNGCHFECDGNTIDFDKSGSYYKRGDYIMYIRDNKICMYKIACKDKKIFYNTGNKFEGETDEYRNPERGTMTYKDGSTFEGNFVIKDNKLRKGEQCNVVLNNKFWD